MIYELKFMISIKIKWSYSLISIFWNIFFNVSTHKYYYFYLFNNIIKKKKIVFRKGKIWGYFNHLLSIAMRVGFLMVVLFDKSKQNHWLWMFWMNNKNEGGEIQRSYAWIIWKKNVNNTKNNCQQFHEIIKYSCLNKWYNITNIT